MEIKDLYPNRKRYYEKHIKELETNLKISKQNKKDLRSFSISLLSTGRTGKYRVGKLLSQLKPISIWLDKEFREANLEDLQQLIANINSKDMAEATKSDYRRSIKQFYYWLEEQDERLLNDSFKIRESAKRIYKFLNKSVSTSFKSKKIDPSEVLNDGDIKQILEKGCKTAQEKAIIITLHETGMRSADLLLTKIGGFKVNERGIGIIYTGDGKTGKRQVDIIRSVPYIQEHLRQHPFKEYQNKLLFYYIDSRNGKIKNLNHGRFYRLVNKCVRDSGISKKCNPHWFRHSRASLDAIDGTMSESVRKRRMGWSEQSKMMGNYTHLGTKEVRNAWLNAKGLSETKEEKEEYITCICQRLISSSLPYCPYCGRPTSIKVIEGERRKSVELQEQIKEMLPVMPTKPALKGEYIEVIKYIMKLMNDPELLGKFEEFKKKQSKIIESK